MSILKKNNGPMSKGPSIQSISGDHWSEIKFTDGIMTDAIMKHVMGLCYLGMADAGEAFEVVSRLNDKETDSWENTWADLASKLKTRAQNSEKNEKKISASTAYLRASTYYRMATMYMEDVHSPKMEEYTRHSFDCYEKSLALSGYPGKYVEIPYEGTYLPGHFYQSPYAKRDKAPLLVLTPGRDTWAVDTRWMFDAALKRGIHCLTYDGPGQGYALRFQNLKFRPDWEKVMGPVLDYAETMDCVDMDHVACMGFSFGGFLMPRVAAFDKRIKLIITDPGNISWGKGIGERLAMIQKMPSRMRPKFMSVMLEDYAWKHGVPEEAVVDELKKYDNTKILDKVECEVLVLDGTAEMTFGAAKELYDALVNAKNKDYILFDDDSTAQCHTQMGGYATGAETIMDWLEDHIDS